MNKARYETTGARAGGADGGEIVTAIMDRYRSTARVGKERKVQIAGASGTRFVEIFAPGGSSSRGCRLVGVGSVVHGLLTEPLAGGDLGVVSMVRIRPKAAFRPVTAGTIDPMDNGTPIGPPWGNPHDRLDEIRRRTHVAIAAKVDADQSLLEVPRGNIHRWAEQAGYLQTAHAEWLEILEKPWPEVRRLLVASDENSTRLRQSSPFTGILSPWERKAVHDAVPA